MINAILQKKGKGEPLQNDFYYCIKYTTKYKKTIFSSHGANWDAGQTKQTRHATVQSVGTRQK